MCRVYKGISSVVVQGCSPLTPAKCCFYFGGCLVGRKTLVLFAMLCYAMLCRAMLCCAMLSSAMSCYAARCCAMLCYG